MKIKIVGFLKSIDRLILRLFGVGWEAEYTYKLPIAETEDQLRQRFIRGYFSSQPSLFKLWILHGYVQSRYRTFRVLRKIYGLMMRIVGGSGS